MTRFYDFLLWVLFLLNPVNTWSITIKRRLDIFILLIKTPKQWALDNNYTTSLIRRAYFREPKRVFFSIKFCRKFHTNSSTRQINKVEENKMSGCFKTLRSSSVKTRDSKVEITNTLTRLKLQFYKRKVIAQ